MTLRDVQQQFQAYLLGKPNDFAAQVIAPPDGDPERRLRVYHHAYSARLSGILRDLYDKTWSYIGDDAFEAALTQGIADHASRSFTLDDYGDFMPGVLAGQFPDDPDVRELAWLEWQMHRVFSGPDADPVAAERLAAVTPEQWDGATLILHPTLVTGEVTTNVGPLWSGLEAGSPPQAVRLEQAMGVRVWRKGLQPSFRMIDPLEQGALSDGTRRVCFGHLCEDIARTRTDDPVALAAGLLAAWLEDGLVVDIETG